MADGTRINQNVTEGDLVYTEEIGSYKYQGVKILHGSDDQANQTEDANPIPIKIMGESSRPVYITDHRAAQVTPPPEGKTAFGEALTGQKESVIALDFAYSLNPLLVTTRDNQSGSSSQANSMMVLSTGAAANSSSCLYSNNIARYQPGVGISGSFTGLFTAGVAGSTQIIGLGDVGEGFFFGFNGTDFGILHRYGGYPEIRTLTVSTGSSNAEDITITLDDDAELVTLTDTTGNETITANEIAAHDYSDVGRGWKAIAVGADVVFTSWSAEPRTGTFSLSGASSAVGTFAQTLAGVTPTSDWTAQADWNGFDKFLDGSGITGVTLDPTMLNVFQIDYQYLGAGLIRFFIGDPGDGEFHLVHSIQYANANTVPSLDNPSIPFFSCVENTTNATNILLKSASCGVFIQGKRSNIGIPKGIKATKILAAATEAPVTSIRMKEVYQSKINRSILKYNLVSASVDHSKPCLINFYLNPVLVNASFVDIDNDYSSIQQDTSADSFSGGKFLFSINLSKTGQGFINLLSDPNLGEFTPGQVLLATLEPTSNIGAEGTVSFNLTEKL